jgi:hypothetical protein
MRILMDQMAVHLPLGPEAIFEANTIDVGFIIS